MYRILDTKMAVSKFALAPLVFAAAFLGAEAARCVHLEVRPRKLLFGVLTKQCLYADPGLEAAAWPDDTLESAIQPAARSLLDADRANVVEDIVYRILQRSMPDPFGRICNLVRDGLAGRDLIEVTAGGKRIEMEVYHYHRVQATVDAALGQLDEVRALLAACHDARPDLWKALVGQISTGIHRRSTGER